MKGRLIVSGLVLGLVAPLVLAQTGTSTSSGGTTTTTSPMFHPGQILEVGPRGHVLLRGTVSSVGSDTLGVTSWGGTWNVHISSDTNILPQSNLSNFHVGDFVGAQGMVDTGAAWAVNATIVRDWTLRRTERTTRKEVQNEERTSRRNGIGRIFEGSASDIKTDSFTLTTGGETYSVVAASGAKFLNRNFLRINFADIGKGDHVRIFGTAVSSTLTALVIRDTSIPHR